MSDATERLPQRWASHGWRAARIASALFVFAPVPAGRTGRCVGDVVPAGDGQWLWFTYTPSGRTLRGRHRDVTCALDAVCSAALAEARR